MIELELRVTINPIRSSAIQKPSLDQPTVSSSVNRRSPNAAFVSINLASRLGILPNHIAERSRMG